MGFPLHGVSIDHIEAALDGIVGRILDSWYEIRYFTEDPVAELWRMIDTLRDYLGAALLSDLDLGSDSARIAIRTAAEAAFGAIGLESWPHGDHDIQLPMIDEAITSEDWDFHYLQEKTPPVHRWLDAYWLMIMGGAVARCGGVLAEDSAPEVYAICGDSADGLVMNALSDYVDGDYPEWWLRRPPTEIRQHHLSCLASVPTYPGSVAGMLRALLADDESAFEHERQMWLAWYREQSGDNPQPRVLLPLPAIGLTALAVHAHGWHTQAGSGYLPAGLPI
ncbi:Imm49 family immunity protein [Nocardia sp. NPDC005978]|uniref:Imm49 family immunity protein n=1 Tax=Nocardia sp. NPDC005978 TaxID=3156725 RepID=UPI0033ACFA77